jgi:hypothetical protein
MKKFVLLLVTVWLSGCVMQQLQQANDLMAQNIETMDASRAAIEENTHQITRSTQGLYLFEILFPILFFVIILALLYICLRLRILNKIFKNRN